MLSLGRLESSKMAIIFLEEVRIRETISTQKHLTADTDLGFGLLSEAARFDSHTFKAAECSYSRASER